MGIKLMRNTFPLLTALLVAACGPGTESQTPDVTDPPRPARAEPIDGDVDPGSNPTPQPADVDEGPAIGGEVPVFTDLPRVPNPAGRTVRIKPVFVVPPGEREPTAAERTLFAQHVQIAQARFHEMLEGQDTFAIDAAPDVVPLAHDAAWYVEHSPEWLPTTGLLVEELLATYGVDRHRSEYLFVMLLVTDDEYLYPGNGMPLNGGFASGGGAISMPLPYLHAFNFQSTLQHELGHSFGLPHVDWYAYDMATNDSIMAYNLDHHTDGLTSWAGELIPEELYGLDMATRLFPLFTWSGAMADEYVLASPYLMPPMPLDQNRYEVLTVTDAGEAFGSVAQSVVQGILLPSLPGIGFDPTTMWHTAYDLAPGTWVSVELSLPIAIELTGLGLHTQHSGLYHQADAVRVYDLDDGEVLIADSAVDAPDVRIDVSAAEVSHLRIDLRVGPSGSVTVRGLRFFEGELELFASRFDLSPLP
jgi:hypothetical protein